MSTPAEKRTGIPDRLAALSPAARKALMNFHARQGAPMPFATVPAVQAELLEHKLVNTRGNLTGLGALVRSRAIDNLLDRLDGRSE
jgi:hypothetical protein